METRKKDHIDLAFESKTSRETLDSRFTYEPMLSAHPEVGLKPFCFLGKMFRAPFWVSSMTGGTAKASVINTNLAKACREFGFGMGLGSCRVLLETDTYFDDFNMRPILGDDLPLYANLGICQIEQLFENNKSVKIIELIKKLRADGLIIHVNPMQEWFQPEGDVLKYPPIDTIKKALDSFTFPIVVKEVGQGIGPDSLTALMKLPLEAIEFGAFGGTNFAKVEMLRDPSTNDLYEPLSYVGVDAAQMVEHINAIFNNQKDVACKQVIISGGIRNFLDGYYYRQKCLIPSVYGQASAFLKHALGEYEELRTYVSGQIKGYEMAQAYLRVH